MVAWSIAGTELVIGVLLLLGIGTVWAGWMAVGLLALFSLAIGVKLFQKERIPCGCGGFFDSSEVSGLHLLRNAILGGLGLLVAVMGSAWADQELPLALRAVSVPLALGVLLCLATAEKIWLIHRLSLSSRTESVATAVRG